MKGLYFNDDVEGGGGVTGVTTTTEPTSQQIQEQPESTLDISSTTGPPYLILQDFLIIF